ncbi:UNVERIFIED_CONTAM: Retrovirus-related Pol polyprotein from transposon RE2 [Sesamum radiatum]|uniref:Retrovirus-related Pol polyprotein from transposon RE2 n=1 Tax=Sesamum radiatum TaxID=300843 RepID=A0AAW2QJ86_SESRA
MNLDGVRELGVVKNFGSDFVTYNIEDDPITFRDAMASSEAKQWKKAIKSEMDSIVSNGIWKLVDLPPGCPTIRCKLIFKKKLKPDGSVDKFKARLVAKAFKQKEGIDYFDTYSPVTRLTTIRVLIAFASVYSHPIHQMDVKIAFLYGELDEENTCISLKGLWLMYLANGTRPYISFSVSKLARYTSCPDRTHWSTFDRVLRWGAVSCKSAKQTLITRSTFEVELCALDTTGFEAEWLFELLSQLPALSQPLPPIVVHCDNQTTITKVRSRKKDQTTHPS